MDISTTSSDQELTEIGANGSGNNNYFNSEMREHMFDKVLTPSDVGKLNRLVIPKQHAENYFPLEDNQNGTTLDFQDRNGKMWRFRYSYWNSSQSYVMTKGWSRFVKEKKLFAGDTVSFHRGYISDENEPENRRKVLFIDWRHRSEINLNQHNFIFGSPTYPTTSFYPVMECYRSFPPFYQFQEREILGRMFNGGRYYTGSPLDHHHQLNLSRSQPLIYKSFPVFPTAPPPQPPEGTSTTTTKKLRLFGVDVEESSSSGETRGEMGGVVAGHSSSSPVVIRDVDETSWRLLPRGDIGSGSVSSSSVMQQRDDEEYRRKGKSLEF